MTIYEKAELVQIKHELKKVKDLLKVCRTQQAKEKIDNCTNQLNQLINK